MKNEMSVGKATGKFILWLILFSLIFSMILNFALGMVKVALGNFIIAYVFLIVLEFIFNVLVLKFAIWNTFKKEVISKENEKQFLINVCIVFAVILLIYVLINFDVIKLIASLISLFPLLFAKKYITDYNK